MTRVAGKFERLLQGLQDLILSHLDGEGRLSLLLYRLVNQVSVGLGYQIYLWRQELTWLLLRVKVFPCLQDVVDTTAPYLLTWIGQARHNNVLRMAEIRIILEHLVNYGLAFWLQIPCHLEHVVDVTSTKLHMW